MLNAHVSYSAGYYLQNALLPIAIGTGGPAYDYQPYFVVSKTVVLSKSSLLGIIRQKEQRDKLPYS